MCRLMAYIGPPRLIADVVLWPDRSIIKQSYDARERLQDPSLPAHLGFGSLNGDGFGIGWFTPDELRQADPAPCMYKSVTPAWNNENLARLSAKIVSPLVFAHVRAAYPGMPVSEQNCHPFQFGRYLWMHNGVVGGFGAIKRRLLAGLSDAAYHAIQSFHSDSAVAFAVFLHHLPDLTAQQPPDVLLGAMQAAISTISSVQDQLGVRDISLLNFVVSDGSTLIATRFVRPADQAAATLYYAEGASFDRQPQQPPTPPGHGPGSPAAAAPAAGAAAAAGGEPGDEGGGCGGGGGGCGNPMDSSVLCEASYSLGYSERGASVAFVASEPITGSTTDWVAVPKNTVLVVTREKGGFLSMLQSSLSTGAQPDPRLAEVSTCLSAIAQGMATKSRAWVTRRQTQGGVGQQGSPWGAVGLRTLPGTSPGQGGAALDALLSPRSSAAGLPGSSLVDGLLGMALNITGEPETISMEEEHMLTGHTRSVLALALDEPSSRLYSSSIDATVRAWDLGDMGCVAVIRGHSKPVTKLQLLGGRLLFTAAGGAVRVWDTRSFVCLAKVRTSSYAGAIRSMLVTADGTLYVGHQDMSVKKYLPLGSTAAAAAAAADGAAAPPPSEGIPMSPRLASGAQQQGAVRPPDAQTDPTAGHVGPVNDLVACGGYICSAGGDTTVRVWRASDLELVRVLRGHRGSVLCLLAVGNVLLSGSRDNTIRVWDLDLDFMCRRTLLGHKDDVVHLDALGLNKAGAVAATASSSGHSPFAAAPAPGGRGAGSSPRAPGTPRGAGTAPPQRAPSPGPYVASVLVASASADGTVRVWSSSWTCLRILTICAPTHSDGGLLGAEVALDAHHQQHQQQHQQQHGGRHGQPHPQQWPLLQPQQQHAQPPQQQLQRGGSAALPQLQQPCSALDQQLNGGSPLVSPQPQPQSGAGSAAGSLKPGSLLSAQLNSSAAGRSPPLSPLPAAAPAAGRATPERVLAAVVSFSDAACSSAASANAAVVGFANEGGSDSAPSVHEQQQVQQQQGQQPVTLAQQWSQLSAPHGPQDPSLSVITSLNGWAKPPPQQQQQQQQQPQQQQQQQAPQQQQEQPCPQAQAQQPQQHQQQQHQQQQPSKRAARRAARAAAHMPATAALVVAISSNHIVGGYSDASIRLWHMDDVYLADLTEQLVSGQLSSGDLGPLALWQEQLRPLSGSFNPFFGSLHPLQGLASSLSHSTSFGLPQADALGASPPLSPTGMAASLAGQLLGGGSGAGLGSLAAQSLLREGSGSLLGVELLGGERSRRRGGWCARLRDAGCCGSAAPPPASPRAAPAAAARSRSGALAGLPEVPELPAGACGDGCGCACGAPGCRGCPAGAQPAVAVHCLACGSQDAQLVRALKDFVAIRTVSANKLLRDECLRGAKYLSRLLEALGAEVKMAQPYEGKNPVVMGRLGHNPAHPTVAFYGHYDVQPAEEPDWRTPPFEMTAVDGYLCGRGTSDNKGPLLAFIYAVKEMLDCWRVAGAAVPLNFAFMFEGEEENGSLGFQESVSANLGWFDDAVLVLISNTVWVGEHKPCLTYGMRGMVTASLVVSGPARDLHSGNDGGVFAEPMADLVQLLGSLHGPGGRISVPGFYTSVRPQLMELAWQGLEHSEEFDMASYRDALGVPRLTAPPNKYDLLNARWCSPTLSIVDIRTTTTAPSRTYLNASRAALAGGGGGGGGGSRAATPPPLPGSGRSSPAPGGGGGGLYAHSAAAAGHGHGSGNLSGSVVAAAAVLGGCPHAHHSGAAGHAALWPPIAGGGGGGRDERSCYRFGPTRFSVIPKVAVGKISLRFVPEQDHATLIECLQQHIHRKFDTLWSPNAVELQVHSVGDWWEADPQSQLFQMAETAVRREWGVGPLYVREGGTMPVASLIEKLLGAPALMIPMGQSSDNCHLANERLRRINLVKGKNVVRHLLEELAASAAPSGLLASGVAAAAAGAAEPAAGGTLLRA